METFLECLGYGIGLVWALCGVHAASLLGLFGLWRITIWLGPLAYLLVALKNRGRRRW